METVVLTEDAEAGWASAGFLESGCMEAEQLLGLWNIVPEVNLSQWALLLPISEQLFFNDDHHHHYLPQMSESSIKSVKGGDWKKKQ